MSIIKLKNVSKFYYKKGVITSGFTRVNLELNMGEFVAITGESGSGKSTLLNVISGLDTYEEGEMYINGEETSHYTEKDFEDYRRKYVGNIFQNFNLVNSYTVYQNIELVLLLNGKKKKEIKNEVLSLIKKVGLYKFRRTKVSRLSGGQKQRVAIARVLAKDTPMIIADEPTGNLDSKSAREIIKLLSEISKDKLVVVVTHNYEQVEEYVTRKIKMHDGRILEDKKIKEKELVTNVKESSHKTITHLNKVRLALRNTFNIVPKFLLILLVYLFIVVSLISEYASFKEQEYIESKSGDNYIFNNISDARIVLKKKDRSAFTKEDYESIKRLDNIDYIVYNDLLLDSYISLSDDANFEFGGSVNDIANFRGNLDVGRMPNNPSEIVIEGSKYDYYLATTSEELMNHDLYFRSFYGNDLDKSNKLRIVGIKYNENENDYNYRFYVNESIINNFSFQTNQSFSTIKYLFQNKYYDTNNWNSSNRITYNSNVSDGYAYISDDNNYICPKENCINEQIIIEVKNLYYKDSIDLRVNKVYNKKTMPSLLGIDNYEEVNGTIFISVNDYNSLFNKDNYQSSVFVKDVKLLDKTASKLDDLGFNVLPIKNTLVSSGGQQFIKILSTVVTIILVIVLFFISYFVIRVILKSRNKYFSTIRILGATQSTARQLLILELFIVSNIAFFSFLIFVYMCSLNIFDVKFVHTIINYLKVKDYIILYIILITMSYLISMKFAKKLFKKSAMVTLEEEV